MQTRLSESTLAKRGARGIKDAFDAYRVDFRSVTQRARSRFERRDWLGLRADGNARLDLYRQAVDATVAQIRDLLDDRTRDRLTWAGMKAVYSGLLEIDERNDWELAETFFNSITRQIFATVGVDPVIEFVDTDFLKPPSPPREAVQRVYDRPSSLEDLFGRILLDYQHTVAYADMTADAQAMAAQLQRHLSACSADNHAELRIDRAEVLTPVFYRNKGAYVIGRLWVCGRLVPMAIALLNPPDGIVVDALLLDENELSIVFSFAHSYFLVDNDRPHELVEFLRSIMPHKRVAELYISLGHHKHGKTELYRDLLQCLDGSTERFTRAPGQPGMVMSVFALPGYDLVVKVIKDRFAEPKTVTRREVIGKYRLVFRHDRAGRLVDAQEFEHLQFPSERFLPELLRELLREAGQTVALVDDQVVINHAYIERRVTPLDVYLHEADADAALSAALDFGCAIKDLAASNIFPGDFFLKNFGVTRHGRVVSYDYDELCLITDLHFGRMPDARSDDEALAPEPWFHVSDSDVFPEEFRTYLRLPRGLDEAFVGQHADLFEPDFWARTQQKLQAGEVIDVFAYSLARRLPRDPLPSSTRYNRVVGMTRRID